MKAIISSILLIIFFLPTNAQGKKHGIESEILTPFPFISALSQRTYKQLNPNLYYTYQFKPNFRFVAGLALHKNNFASPCPANYCSGYTTNELVASLGLRRNLWQMSKQSNLFGELSIIYTAIDNFNWGAGGFTGVRTEYTQNGFGLGALLRLGYQHTISPSFYLSVNSSLNISNWSYEQRTTNNWLNGTNYVTVEDLKSMNLSSNLLGLRIGYNF